MSTIKSYGVYNGDMFYIKHGSDNFTIIDCNLDSRNKEVIIEDLKTQSSDKGIKRFISTHPDEDHISGLKYIVDNMGMENFYCVKNKAIKDSPSEDFKKYCELRDSNNAFHIEKNSSRRWMNMDDKERGSSGISVLWPDINNSDYKHYLAKIENGESPNNTSAIIKYNLGKSVTALWMGDLEKDFMEKIEEEVDWPETDILFAPHHGRKSGKIPVSILNKIKPKIVIIGQAPSENLDYYDSYKKITQNSTGDIIFDCIDKKVRIYVALPEYKVDFLSNENLGKYNGLNYIGTLEL